MCRYRLTWEGIFRVRHHSFRVAPTNRSDWPLRFAHPSAGTESDGCIPFLVRFLMAGRMKALVLLLVAGTLWGQPDFKATLTGFVGVSMAVPDLQGVDKAQPLMAVFNQTLWDDLDESGWVQLRPKSNYPKAIPQQPHDLHTGSGQGPAADGGLQSNVV